MYADTAALKKRDNPIPEYGLIPILNHPTGKPMSFSSPSCIHTSDYQQSGQYKKRHPQIAHLKGALYCLLNRTIVLSRINSVVAYRPSAGFESVPAFSSHL